MPSGTSARPTRLAPSPASNTAPVNIHRGFVVLNVATQYRVSDTDVTAAYYKLMEPEVQIKSYIEDALRSSVPQLTLDELFEKKDQISLEVQQQVAEEMAGYGYIIVNYPLRLRAITIHTPT